MLAVSLHSWKISPVPEETRGVAQAASPCGNVYMGVHGELGTLYEDQLFAPFTDVSPSP